MDRSIFMKTVHLAGSNVSLLRTGKVREMWEMGPGHLLMVATDRISNFDQVAPNGITDKGRVLTQQSVYWFEWLAQIMPWLKTHFVTAKWSDIVAQYPQVAPYESQWRGRCMLVLRADKMFGFEAVCRGYLYGSGLKDYKATQAVCGNPLPKGLVKASILPHKIFTPATKESGGDHDENISFAEIISLGLASPMEATAVANAAMYIFDMASQHTEDKGILLPDTKLEFGLWNGMLMLGDEVLTPDSSRYWPADKYVEGENQPSYDKQITRTWCEDEADWDKNSPHPEIPADIVKKTHARYLEGLKLLTGRSLDSWLEAA